MQYIDSCIASINSAFPDSFFSAATITTGLPDEEQEEQFIQELKLEIDLLATNIFGALHYTLLSGNYIEFSQAKLKLTELQRAAGNIGAVIEQGLKSVSSEAGVNFYNSRLSSSLSYSFNGVINDAISLFRHFIHQIESELEKPELTTLFRTNHLDEKTEDVLVQVILAISGIEFETRNHYNLLKYNLKIASLDHKLLVAKEPLNELLQVKEKLGSQGVDDPAYLVLLRDKCDFLLYKILKRLEEDEQSYIYTHELQDKEVKKEDLSISHYKEFKDLTDSHYQENLKPNSAQKLRYKKYEPKLKNGTLTEFGEYHTLIKFKKDFHPSIEKLENLTYKFNDLIDLTIADTSSTDLFDKRASFISQNYAYNNCFSLCLQKCDNLKIKSKLEAVNELQDTTEVHNYFPYFYYSRFLENKIKEKLSNAQSSEDLKDINDDFSELDLVLKKCFENFEWCRDRAFLAYQLPFKECKKTVDINNQNYEIFLSSSFILPLNYNKIKIERDALSREYSRLQTLHEVKLEIVAEKKEIKKQSQDLQHFINSHDRKQVEILSIFAALVFFTAGSIKVFEKAVLFSEVVLFMLATAYSLGLFVILIWLITRNYSVKNHWLHWFFVSAYILITVFLISYLIHLPWVHNVITWVGFEFYKY
ncbi:hypothetical protein MKJ04_04790 [Pontibacter sp. E15-1]|uniref:hypothetical protein n=1 Tax=Pontibacter sp. E15-1 TaxID=2919918 RepID=UPI001F4FF62F|nr:hypothetical protein [Pontibacter sp. E15-1]MCJ8164148.1 hypothetical protein [Pontibacter sp. E15-1]